MREQALDIVIALQNNPELFFEVCKLVVSEAEFYVTNWKKEALSPGAPPRWSITNSEGRIIAHVARIVTGSNKNWLATLDAKIPANNPEEVLAGKAIRHFTEESEAMDWCELAMRKNGFKIIG